VFDDLFPGLSDDETGGTPREVVHAPERIEREEERKDRDGENVEEHPTDHVPLPAEDEYQRLQTVDGRDHDDRQLRNGLALSGHDVDQVDDLMDGYDQ
jgi:hypothetical protein